MDYGKIAYYKAEELEQRLARPSFKTVTKTVTDVTLGAQPVTLFHLSGGGIITVRVVSSGGAVSVHADGVIGQGTGGFTVTCAAENCDIAVSGGAQAESVSITAAGTNISLS